MEDEEGKKKEEGKFSERSLSNVPEYCCFFLFMFLFLLENGFRNALGVTMKSIIENVGI